MCPLMSLLRPGVPFLNSVSTDVSVTAVSAVSELSVSPDADVTAGFLNSLTPLLRPRRPFLNHLCPLTVLLQP